MSIQPSGSTSSHLLLSQPSDHTVADHMKSSKTSHFLDPDIYLSRPHYFHHLHQHQHEEEEDEEKTHGFSSPILSPRIHPPRPPSSSRGNFGVLCLWAFATVTSLLATYNLFLPTTSNHVIFPTAFVFGGISQVVGGFFVLANGNTFGGILFVSYGSFWTGSGLMMLPTFANTLSGLTSTEVQVGNGIYHFIWAIYCLIHITLSLRIKGGHFMMTWNLVWVFFTLFLTGVSCMVETRVPLRLAGATAYLAALGAWYTGAAELLESQGQELWLGYYHHRK